ncbi:MAG: adenosylcobinamide-GDP ribazoletransferase [Gammaproteobacteria bacterium]|nr:adenosylcobinamide-GDP ribazoletransferase [Gammaproteobacteria bacterium]MCP5135340.1 adenosylcobinamide-GDP ribazoletransferase [Gammaproteobacteria bacterium]
MTTVWHAFLIAIQFLTIFPVPLKRAPTEREWGVSVMFYPLVGALLGAMFWGLAIALAGVPALLSGALIVALWGLATGALHIDGLADCADAWVGGYGDRERSLRIMKDPASGPVAVATIVVVLLLKFASVTVVIGHDAMWVFLVAPILARTSATGLLASTPYVRTEGIATPMMASLPRRVLVILALTIAVLMGLFVDIGAVLAAVSSLLAVRFLAMRRLHGITGDVAGALVEISEMTILLSVALAKT